MNQFSDWSEDEIESYLNTRPDEDVEEFTKDNIPEGVNFIGDGSDKDWYFEDSMEKRLRKYTERYNNLRKQAQEIYPQDAQFEEAYLDAEESRIEFQEFKNRIKNDDMTAAEFEDYWRFQLDIRDGLHREMNYRKRDD